MTTTLISRCRLVATMDSAGTEIPDASIVIEDGWIKAVASEPLDILPDHEIDGRTFLALPGFINTHHHLYQTLTRGFPLSEGKSLFEWLQMLYPIWAGLDEEMIFTSTQAGLTELLLSGCTTSSDHLYVFPPGGEHFIDAQMEAAQTVGVRFHATRGSMDLGRSQGGLPPDSVVQSRDIILADSERVVNRYHDSRPGAMRQVGLAPCSPFSVSAELMSETAGLARELGVRLHTHIAETMDEESYSLRTFGVRPVELLNRLSWVEEDVWLAHCVHLDQTEIRQFGARGTGVAHCPTSNMLLGSGLAPIRDLLKAGANVGVGVDGSASNDGNDLRNEIKQSILGARTKNGSDALSVRQALRLATTGGAKCLGRDDVGTLEPGKAADVLLFDLDTLECSGAEEDPLAAVVLGSASVDTVMVHGEILVEGGVLKHADKTEIAQRQRSSSQRLMRRWRVGQS